MQVQKGFTLMELLIAIAIVAILSAIAVPTYRGYTQRAARADVQATLMTAASAMERLKSQNFTYDGATAGTTFPAYSPVGSTSSTSKYNLSILPLKSDGTAAGSGDVVAGFEVLAISTSRFDRTRTEALKVNHLGRKCYKAGAYTCAIGTDESWP